VSVEVVGYIEDGRRFSEFLKVYCTVTSLGGFRHFHEYNELSYHAEFVLVKWLLFPGRSVVQNVTLILHSYDI
jgi:hypothetical protein